MVTFINLNILIKMPDKKRILLNYSNVTNNKGLIALLKIREEVEKQIESIDSEALLKYELERLNQE
jgi:hypothetical protein